MHLEVTDSAPSIKSERHAQHEANQAYFRRLISDGLFELAADFITTATLHSFLPPAGFADLIERPSDDIRPGFRYQADCCSLIESYVADFQTSVIPVLHELYRYVADFLPLANALTRKLCEYGRHAEALKIARESFQQKQNCVFTESVLKQVLLELCPNGAPPEGATLSDIEKALLCDFGEYFCSKPFTNYEVFRTGEVFVCCGSLVPASIGNVNRQDFEGIWNSDTARQLRRSVVDGTFRYCSRTCPALRSNSLPSRANISPDLLKQWTDDSRAKMEQGPKYANLAHDTSCNLSCPSCRRENKVADAARRRALDIVYDRGIQPLLPSLVNIQIAGDGDPFASKHYRQILAGLSKEKYPHLRLKLLTNGVLFDEREWMNLPGMVELLEEVSVSIDAATEETYREVRRGGDWPRLMKNLEFLAERHREGAFSAFSLNFVTQRSNYRELPQFVELGKKLGATRLEIQAVHNQTEAFTAVEFARAEVTSPGHPEYPELLRVLSDSRMKDPICQICFPFENE